MYPLTKSLDFPLTTPNQASADDWDDAYSDGDQGEISQGFDDVFDDYGFVEPIHLTYGAAPFAEAGHSDDSDSDDDENEPVDFDDLPATPNHGNTRKLPHTPCCSTPFWFGDEDPQHVHRLLLSYEKALGVDKEQARVLRGDIPFVGRVLRRQVLDMKGMEFLTIDAVDVYLNEQVPQGMPLTLVRHAHVLTKWDQNSGLPIEATPISRKSARTQWKPLVRPGVSSWLFCQPHGLTRTFTYSTSRIECPMRHSNDKPFSYQQFLPKRSQEDEDEMLNAMPVGSPGSSPSSRPSPNFHHS